MRCLAASKHMQTQEVWHEWELKDLPSKTHFRENKEVHLFVSSSFLKVWHCWPPSFHFCQTNLITWGSAVSDKDSLLKFIREVVCRCSPVLCCCQGVNSCLIAGIVILKADMTDLMPGQFVIPLLCAVGPFAN